MNLTQLFQKSKTLNYTHSNGMKPVEEMRGPGFFPGCTGTIDSRQDISGLRFMVLGQDFDTATNHQLIDSSKGEIEHNTTWRNLKVLLHDLAIEPSDCFFTNAYMGLRPNQTNEKNKNTGESPASKRGAELFAKDCQSFLKKQLEVIQPEVVLVLGKETAKFVSKAFPDECSKWKNFPTLKKLYEDEDNISIEFNLDGKPIQFLFVIHPSLNNSNRSITWGKGKWEGKEQELLRKKLSRKDIAGE